MINYDSMVEELYSLFEWQKFPVEMKESTFEEYIRLSLTNAVRTLFRRTGRFAMYDTMVAEAGDPELIEYDMPSDEYEYVMITAQIDFYRKIANSVNTMTSYTTDALSITGGDKPYANIKGEITTLEAKQREAFLDITRHTLL